jgi:hypothetical protein
MKHVITLIEKAAKANAPSDALHFSQAATNLANALCTLNATFPFKVDKPAATVA